MECSPRSLEGGLGQDEKVPPKLARVDSQKENMNVKRASLHPLPLVSHSQDGQIKNRRTSVKLLFLRGFAIVAFLFMVFHNIPIVSTWFEGGLGTWLKVCSTHLGRQELSIVADKSQAEDLATKTRVEHEVPQYVLDFAPLVHLYSEEQFWPCDIKDHLLHVTPELNYSPIEGLPPLNLSNLDLLNRLEKGRDVFLTSNDNVEDRPDWLGGQVNIPDDYTDDSKHYGSDTQAISPKFRTLSRGGHSDAPAVLVTINKGDGIVDAFWFFFYSYNLGNVVFNVRFGNHIGDWEHTLVRFQHGKPKIVFVSEHFFGSAYSYSAVEKIGKRVSMKRSLNDFALMCHSPLCILQLAPMRCMQRQVHIRTSSLSESSTTKQIAVRFGILLSTHSHTRTIMSPTICAPPTEHPTLPLNGSILQENGAINSTH